MDTIEWLKRSFDLRSCNSEAFFYDDMASQSGYCLPIIYQPFDVANRGHWADRGAMFDFLFATQGEGKKLLDFGPGDGWPSLIVAPYAGEVIGVDGSQRRVDVCTENAQRLGIGNARFIHVEPGQPLPFEDSSFDGVMAASSIEQTPDPYVTLQELYRVLKPGGRLRMYYEGLNRYRNGAEKGAELGEIHDRHSVFTLYNRHIDGETADMVRLILSRPVTEFQDDFPWSEAELYTRLTPDVLEALRPWVIDARICTLRHPSGQTYSSWLKDIGFQDVRSTHNGIWFASRLFEKMPEAEKPKTIAELDKQLMPQVKVVIQMSAPLNDDRDPMLTAVK